jgi:predicted site-specific integrase-resolvase
LEFKANPPEVIPAEIANITKKEKTTVLRWIKAGRFGNILKVGNEYRVPHFSIVITLAIIERMCYIAFNRDFHFFGIIRLHKI